MTVQLTVFDGAQLIGGNKIYLFADGTGVFFDFGLSFSVRSRFFDEFLRPRSALGLVDYLAMGLLPPIPGIYREDLFPPGLRLWDRYNMEHNDNIEGVLLSHA
ncbi:MAG TPA: exonuclease, partial [Firmicutes bacterium]|nr:exonuclease [Bacillota bacterium]